MPHPITVTREHLDLSTLSSGTRAVLGGGGGGGREGGREGGEILDISRPENNGRQIIWM